nr:hypothetical protein [Streptomyces tsukubensis NRRL18488]
MGIDRLGQQLVDVLRGVLAGGFRLVSNPVGVLYEQMCDGFQIAVCRRCGRLARRMTGQFVGAAEGGLQNSAQLCRLRPVRRLVVEDGHGKTSQMDDSGLQAIKQCIDLIGVQEVECLGPQGRRAGAQWVGCVGDGGGGGSQAAGDLVGGRTGLRAGPGRGRGLVARARRPVR